jgi:hypothetical protein
MSIVTDKETWEKIWQQGELGKREYDLNSFDETGVAEYLTRFYKMNIDEALRYVQSSFAEIDRMMKVNHMEIPEKYRAYLVIHGFESDFPI